MTLYTKEMSWPLPNRRFWQCWQVISPISIGDFANTGEGTFSNIWAGLRSKQGILKTWDVVLELCLNMDKEQKKIDFGYRHTHTRMFCLSIFAKHSQDCCFFKEYQPDSKKKDFQPSDFTLYVYMYVCHITQSSGSEYWFSEEMMKAYIFRKGLWKNIFFIEASKLEHIRFIN